MGLPAKDITHLVGHLGGGDKDAWEELLPLVYDELHRLAERYMRLERRDHTLQPTALVNEAYLKLARWKKGPWHNRSHFLAAAALVMRQVLVDHAKTARRAKRGGRQGKISLGDVLVSFEERSLGLVELNDALDHLARHDERSGQVVNLRFFGGLNFEQIAGVLEVSESTVVREWKYAKAWLYRELGEVN